jgi:hypothetical protein
MKKMSFCFLVLFASFILAVQSFGQNSQSDSIKYQHDSVKTDLNLSSEVVKKLNNKDIVEIIKYREKLAQEKEMARSKMNLPNLTSESTATIWSILIVIFILSLFAIPYYFNLKKVKARQQIITKLIEKDRDIPKELLAKPQKTRRSDLHKGIVLIAFGLSISVVIFFLRIQGNFWTIGLIPVFIGIGYLISFKLSQSYNSKSEID